MSLKKKLIEERAKTIMDAQELSNRENFGAEDDVQFKKMMNRASELKNQIDAMEQADREAAALNAPKPFAAGLNDLPYADGDKAARAAKYGQVFDKYLRQGASALDGDEQKILRNGFQNNPQNALSSGTAANGGYTVPTSFFGEMDKALKAFIGPAQAGATVINTTSGEQLQLPTMNDTGNVGRIISEGGAANVVDAGFGQLTLGGYIYTSDVILVSLQLLQDTGVNLESYISEIAAERVGRIQNTHMTTGTGTGQPQGVVTGAVSGKVAASATAFTFDELTDLKFSVDAAYRNAPNAAFMVADSTLGYLTKMKDGENRPLLLPSARDGEPDRILNKPVYGNTDMAGVATGNKSVLFGDFSKYKIRNVSGDFIARLDQPYMANFQVAFVYFRRTDAKLANAGTNPMKYLVQA